MFFTDYEFLFLFLPVALAGFYLARRFRLAVPAEYWLVLLSLFFYWALDRDNIVTLLGSAAINYLLAWQVASNRERRPGLALALLWVGIGFNVLFLLAFKYVGAWLGISWPAAIPLGISFFSIQHIAYLVSTYGEDPARPPFRRFVLFTAFFPYVVAGPIVLKKDLMDQYDRLPESDAGRLILPALTLFSMGLFKKVVLADSVTSTIDVVFSAANHHGALSAADAWLGALLYTLQIYFDFSGYSDMAAGVAGLFGIRLPRNFHSPFKASSIMEFWRRWHMSVTRFFTNFVYLPLVVKLMRIVIGRRIDGEVVRFVVTVLVPMIATFVLIGVWHGAGANFLAFGLLMGAALSINHLWIKLRRPALPKGLGWLLTMAIVVAGMTLDRSPNLDAAKVVFGAMAGLGGSAGTLVDVPFSLAWVAGLGAVALFAPNTHEIMARHPVVLDEEWEDAPKWTLRWSPRPLGVVFASLAFSIALVFIPKAAQFIYYRF